MITRNNVLTTRCSVQDLINSTTSAAKKAEHERNFRLSQEAFRRNTMPGRRRENAAARAGRGHSPDCPVHGVKARRRANIGVEVRGTAPQAAPRPRLTAQQVRELAARGRALRERDAGRLLGQGGVHIL